MGLEYYKPIIVMLGCQLLYAGTNLFVRAALLEKMSSSVFVVYRQFIGFLLMAPFAYFSRKGKDGCLNWKSFWLIFLLSFVGVTANHNSYYMGMTLVSTSVASAMYNLAPAITFLMAYTMGLEKVGRSWGSFAKIIGTVVCVSGAAVMALLEGPKLLEVAVGVGDDHTRVIGCLLIFASSCCWSFALILQARVNESYPDYVSMTALMCLMASVQSGIFTMIVAPSMDVWKLTTPIQIFSCLFAGMTSAITFFAQAWCVARRGPLFSALFQPLCTVIVTVLGYIFLHEDLYLGSVTGGVAVIIGLYIVLWGKAKDNSSSTEEMIKKTLDPQICESCKIDLEEPLLPEKPSN
ncbi:WAT1-related protein At4g30420-like [Salvia splendens]|uniref:WAT1-related protein At4g30420-like n=1 Tax=Salvia splendens TaxID=180675 RepID=UPI001C254316|nr:WAT1-related protein At4g30420-like [Salvia splendens]